MINLVTEQILCYESFVAIVGNVACRDWYMYCYRNVLAIITKFDVFT